jgi:hypothetical protein
VYIILKLYYLNEFFLLYISKMNPNLNNIISGIVPNEYIFAKDDDLHRITTIVNMIHNKYPSIPETILIKSVIFYIIRETSFNTATLLPYLIIGLKQISINDLQNNPSPQIIATKLLIQNNEINPMDKVNTSLSAIVDNLPQDLKENMSPSVKQAITQFLMSLVFVHKESFADSAESTSENNTNNSWTYYSDINPSCEPSATPSSAPSSAPSSTPSSTTPVYHMVKSDGCNGGGNKEILGRYVDTEANLYVGRNDKVYVYDKLSNTLNYLPNNQSDISVSQLEAILKEYNIDPSQIEATIAKVAPYATKSSVAAIDSNNMSSANTNSILTSNVFSSILNQEYSDTNKLIDILKNYQDEYKVTNYVVSSIIVAICFAIVIYIFIRIYMASTTTLKTLKTK